MTTKSNLQTFLEERDGNWVLRLASCERLVEFAIAVTDDPTTVQEEYNKLTHDVFNELYGAALKDSRPPVPAQATKAA